MIQTSLLPVGALFYLGVHRARHRLRKIRYAKMLLPELDSMHNSLMTINEHHGQWSGLHEPFAHNVYDGLVVSTNISYFDSVVQDKLHSLYELVEEINSRVVELSDPNNSVSLTSMGPGNKSLYYLTTLEERLRVADGAVVEFFKQNNRLSWWWRVLKVVESADDD